MLFKCYLMSDFLGKKKTTTSTVLLLKKSNPDLPCLFFRGYEQPAKVLKPKCLKIGFQKEKCTGQAPRASPCRRLSCLSCNAGITPQPHRGLNGPASWSSVSKMQILCRSENPLSPSPSSLGPDSQVEGPHCLTPADDANLWERRLSDSAGR